MRRILILLTALSIPFAFAQSASASHASEIDGRAVVTFYDAAGEAIGTAGTTTDLSAAATVEVVTPDGTVHTFEVAAAADSVTDTTVMHHGEEVSLLTVLTEVATDAEVAPDGGDDAPTAGGEVDADAEGGATVEVEVDAEAGTTTRTVTTPSGVVVRIVQSEGAPTEVTIDRPDAPLAPDGPSEAPADEGEADDDTEAEADVEVDAEVDAEADVDVGIGVGAGKAAD